MKEEKEGKKSTGGGEKMINWFFSRGRGKEGDSAGSAKKTTVLLERKKGEGMPGGVREWTEGEGGFNKKLLKKKRPSRRGGKGGREGGTDRGRERGRG